jgi:sulfhydrogenase subunit beta (sulfur reductase)
MKWRAESMPEHSMKYLPRERFQDLLKILQDQGYRCVGPTVRNGAIVYDTLERAADLPTGVRDTQQPGEYRLTQSADERFFAWANGPQALKPLLFAPVEPLWRGVRTEQGFRVEALAPEAAPIAVIGARACDLAALRIQDKIFLQGEYPDPYYATRREGLFLVAVNCTHSAATCFCASTGDGPRATFGFDLALTELDDGFTVEAAGARGEAVLAQLGLPGAEHAQREAAEAGIAEAAARQTRSLPKRNLRDLLFANLKHDRWDNVAERCLSCGNCTLVCPTCFCHSAAETPSLDGNTAEHTRQWDSCFSEGHARMHGFQVRPERRQRYRQWMTHKLGSWHDQFGMSGCIGCGRCIAWCPVGIDITEETWAIWGGEYGSLG